MFFPCIKEINETKKKTTTFSKVNIHHLFCINIGINIRAQEHKNKTMIATRASITRNYHKNKSKHKHKKTKTMKAQVGGETSRLLVWICACEWHLQVFYSVIHKVWCIRVTSLECIVKSYSWCCWFTLYQFYWPKYNHLNLVWAS